MDKKNIVIIGAGNAGETLASEILTSEICFFTNFAILKVELNK